MRIALVAQEYPPETAKGGIGTQTHLKAHGLAALGHDVHVISRSTTAQRIDRRDGAVQVTRVPGMQTRMSVHTEVVDWLGYSAAVAAVLAELHAKAAFDLAEFPEWGAEAYVHLLNRTSWNYLPTVIQLHGPLVMFGHTMGWPPFDSEFYRTGTLMEATCLRLADRIFSSSYCSAEWCRRSYGLLQTQIPVLHAGVDIRQFSPQPIPKDLRPTILFAGKIAANKGVTLLLQAALELVADFPDLQLRLIGRGEEKILQGLRQTAARAGHPQILDLPGFTSREDLPLQLSRGHVFAAPSIYEGGPGFVYLEAMACGLPVIACQGSGAAEVVRPGQNGLLIPPNDLPALVGALRPLLADQSAGQAMGQRGRQFVIDHANSIECLLSLEAFYLSVISQRQA